MVFQFFFSPDPRHIPVFVTLLVNHRNEDLRLKILKLMADVIASQNVPEGNRSYWHLKHIGLSAVTKLLSDDASEPLIKSLLRLAVSEHDANKGVDVLMHYHVVLAVLELLENVGLETKLFVSHMVREVFPCWVCPFSARSAWWSVDSLACIHRWLCTPTGKR